MLVESFQQTTNLSMCALNGPGPFNGFVRTLDDAKAEFAAAWGAWLQGCRAERRHGITGG
jgi:hypothetical protein